MISVCDQCQPDESVGGLQKSNHVRLQMIKIFRHMIKCVTLVIGVQCSVILVTMCYVFVLCVTLVIMVYPW